MAGPYDYTVNIPQPPAQNFLQSLMGIRQLQQMEDQSAIQQQQAAIAQQNAAFQQQMQPLEMDKVREQIKAAQASAAQSTASTRGLNLSADEVKRQQDYIKEVDTFTSKPVSEWAKEDVERLARLSLTKDAKIGKGLQDFYASQKEPELKLIDDYAMKAGIAISQGRKDVADKITKQGITEADKLGFKTASAFFKFGDSQIAEDSAEAYATIVGHLARDEKKLKQFIDASELKGKLAKTEAETEKELAGAKAEKAKLAPGGEKISDKQQSDINALTDEAVTARMNVAGVTDSVNELLKFAEQNPKEFKSGVEASFQNFFSSISGDTTRAQNLRASIQPYATKEWIAKAAGLKGSLSEKEGARLDKGAPDVMKAGPQELLSWARLVQKVELADADRKELNAAWQQNARSLQSKAPVGFEVAGITVKPGESYQQVLTKLQAGYKKKSEQDVLDDAIRLKRIKEAEQSGRTPVPNMYNLGGAPQQPRPAAAPSQISGTPERQSLLNKYR
jgi:hypothetical protein